MPQQQGINQPSSVTQKATEGATAPNGSSAGAQSLTQLPTGSQ